MKTTIKLFIAMFVLYSAQQANAVFYDWGRYYNGGGNDKGLHTTTDAFGNVYFTGVASLAGGNKIVTSDYTDAGVLIGQRTANTFLPGAVKQVERDNALNTFVLCENSPTSYTLIRYNSNGIERWRHNYGSLVIKFKVGNPGAIYICGLTSSGVVMRRMNKNNGATVWTRSYSDASLISYSSRSDFTIDAGSNVYFCGTTGNSTDLDYRMIKLNKNGVLIYNQQYDAGSNNDEEAFKIAANAAGELFVIGDYNCYIPVRDFVHMVKFNAAGVHQWHTQFTTSSTSAIYYALDVMIGPDGNPVGVGEIRDFYNVNPLGETVRIDVCKFNALTGTIIFNVFPNDPGYSNPDLIERPKCMTIDATNNIYIGGTSNVYAGVGIEPNRWLALKVLGTTGLREWVEAGGGEDPLNEIADVAVTAAHNSYWAGSERFSGTLDMWLTKYCEVGCFSPRISEGINSDASIKLTPNPSATGFNIYNDKNESFTLYVYDLTGKLIEIQNSTESSLKFGQKLAPGVYFARYASATENKTIRIIKTE